MLHGRTRTRAGVDHGKMPRKVWRFRPVLDGKSPSFWGATVGIFEISLEKIEVIGMEYIKAWGKVGLVCLGAGL